MKQLEHSEVPHSGGVAGIVWGLVITLIFFSLVYGAYCLGHGYGLEVGMNLGTLGALD